MVTPINQLLQVLLQLLSSGADKLSTEVSREFLGRKQVTTNVVFLHQLWEGTGNECTNGTPIERVERRAWKHVQQFNWITVKKPLKRGTRGTHKKPKQMEEIWRQRCVPLGLNVIGHTFWCKSWNSLYRRPMYQCECSVRTSIWYTYLNRTHHSTGFAPPQIELHTIYIASSYHYHVRGGVRDYTRSANDNVADCLGLGDVFVPPVSTPYCPATGG